MNYPFIRLLAIENDPAAAGLLRGWLDREKAYPFEMEWRKTFAEGVDRSHLGGLDLIIIDVSLPDVNGNTLIATFRRLTSRIPIVVLIGPNDLEFGRLAVEAGVQEVLVKGEVNSGMLSRAVLYAIERHRVRSSVAEESFTDSVTGLLNEKYFKKAADDMLEHAKRSNDQHCLLICEAFDLKPETEQLEPVFTEALLVSIALLFKRCFRASDLIARTGLNQFQVLALDSDFQGSQILEKRLQSRLLELGVTAYFGYSVYDPKFPRDLKILSDSAMEMMEREKRSPSEKRRQIERLSGTSRIPSDLQVGSRADVSQS
jgi:diguanylate cyclase (GGDEF)-like protein